MITPIQTRSNEYDFNLIKARIENGNDGSPPPFPKHLMDKLEINQPKQFNKLQPIIKRRNKRKVKGNNNKSRAEQLLTIRKNISEIKKNIKPINIGVPIPRYAADNRRIALCTPTMSAIKPQPRAPINHKSIPLITPSPSLRPSVPQHRHTPIYRRSKASRQPTIPTNNINHRLMLSDSCSEVSYSDDILFAPSIAESISTLDTIDIDIGITTFNPFDIYNNDHRKLKIQIDAKPTYTGSNNEKRYNDMPWYHDQILS